MKKFSYTKYASGILSISIISQLFHSYNYSFYVDELGLAVASATIAKLFFIGFDAVNDIFVGNWSDKTNSKLGKRTPWLLYGAPFFAFALVLTYLPNQFINIDKTLLFLYYMVVTLLFELFASIMFINYGALFPMLYRSEKERANASAVKQAFSMVGMAIGAALPPLLFESIGYTYTSILYGLLALTIMIGFLKGFNEKEYQTSMPDTTEKKASLMDAFKNTYHNKRFLYYNLAQAFALSVNAVVLTAFPFYAQYSIQISQAEQTIVLLCFFSGSLFSMPLWKKIVIKNGINNTWILSFAIYACTLLTLLFAFNLWTAIFAASLIGVGLAGIFITPDLLMAYIIDIDYNKSKVHREASFMAISNFVQKISLAISAIVVWIITSSFGFVSGEQPGDHPGLAFKILIGLIPVVLLAIGYFCANRYVHYDNTHVD